jgi:signal transduction histidine kinase
LPDTRAELAVPLRKGQQVLGVLDVHAERRQGLGPNDLIVLQLVADHVATAIDNARLYAQQTSVITRLRELDRLRSSFLANMSHELRTPLNSVIGFTEVILEGIDGEITERMGHDLQVIHRNSTHLLSLINDVLDMAKIEAGRMELSRESFDLSSLLDETARTTLPLAQQKGLRLVVEAPARLDVDADRLRVRQVLLNLLGNSVKFTERGTITLRAVAEPAARRVLVSVHDLGIGVKPEDLPLIFEEFRQADNSTTRRAGGTGLGLPISRRLIEMHGGRLWGESSGVPGEGSTFYFTLELAELPEYR